MLKKLSQKLTPKRTHKKTVAKWWWIGGSIAMLAAAAGAAYAYLAKKLSTQAPDDADADKE